MLSILEIERITVNIIGVVINYIWREPVMTQEIKARDLDEGWSVDEENYHIHIMFRFEP